MSIITSYLYMVTSLWVLFVTADNVTYQPLLFAALQNHYRQTNSASFVPQVTYESNEDRDLGSHDTSDYENEDEYYAEPPRIVYKPLIVVLLDQLRGIGSSFRSPSISDASPATSPVPSNKSIEKPDEESSSGFFDALTYPFRILQSVGISSLSGYMPSADALKSYGQFYNSIPRADSTTADELEVQVKIEEIEENLRKGSQKSAINGPPPSSYDKFAWFFPYIPIAFKIGTYFVPGLSQYKMAIVGLEVVRISWKMSSMYNNGESWSDMGEGLGRELFAAVLGRRDELDALKSSSAMTTFVDISSLDIDTFMKLAKESTYPPLKDKDEEIIRRDIVEIVDKYMDPENNKPQKQKDEIIQTIEMAAKFIALHAIIPALKSKNNSNS